MSLSLIKKLALGGVATLALTSAAYAQTVRVTVAEYSSKTQPYFEEAAAAFEEANPGSDIQIEVVPWDVLLQKLTTDISAGANADLSIIGTRWLIDFVEQGVAAPLDEYMDEDFRSRFIDVFLEPSVMDGQTYGLPVAASARAMYYNKSLFEQAGVEDVPANWDELKAAAEKIGALGDDVHGFGLQAAEIETDVYFYYAFWSFGGDLIEADGTLREEPVSGVPEVFVRSQAGLFEVALDPEYETTGRLFLSYACGTEAANNTCLVSARLQDNSLTEVTEIFRAQPAKRGGAHYGGRLAFLPDNTLVLGLGDAFIHREEAQNPTNHLGSTIRINRDGTIPKDNPFYGRPGVRWEIYAYGLRNPYRFKIDPETNHLYMGVVGPDGPTDYDEYNVSLQGGENFGWPRETGRLLFNEWTPEDIPNWAPSMWEYTYEAGGRSATVGAFYRSDGAYAFPHPFQEKLFLFDWARRWIKWADVVEDEWVADSAASVQATPVAHRIPAKRLKNIRTFDMLWETQPISMEVAPDGSIYVAEFTGFWDAAPGARVTRYRWVDGK